MATWPSTLPRPTPNGYNLNPVDPVTRTDMETGAPRVRRRTAARNDKLSVAWEFTDAQMATFRAWFDDASAGAAGGASWFTVDLALGTGGVVSSTARFAGIYKANHLGGLNWAVSADLEVR